jgi:hypothetical protein
MCTAIPLAHQRRCREVSHRAARFRRRQEFSGVAPQVLFGKLGDRDRTKQADLDTLRLELALDDLSRFSPHLPSDHHLNSGTELRFEMVDVAFLAWTLWLFRWGHCCSSRFAGGNQFPRHCSIQCLG